VTAKLRIKTKGIEIEWEGEVEFLKSEVPDLIASIIQAIGINIEEPATDEDAQNDLERPTASTFTTAAAAAKMQTARSGPELFKVALAKLQISDGIEPATRDQILEEMRKAPRLFNENMRKNMTQTIGGLLSRGDINEPADGKYTLSHSAHEAFTQKFNA
jgi:hypothetical protein